MRLSQAARWNEEGSGESVAQSASSSSLCGGGGTTGRRRRGAARYDDGFGRAMAFLDRSEQEYIRAKAEQDRERRRKLLQARWTAAVFGVLFVIAGVLAYVARQENRRATQNLGLAKDAVDQTLSSAGLDPASAGADVPQMTEFRRELLEKAKSFYDDFLKQDARSEALRREMALAHLRLGHIDRWLEKADEAARDYQQAATLFEALGKESDSAEYRQGRANAYNWLGLTLTPIPDRAADAEKAYGSALALQEDLMRASPARADYQQEAARTRYNRGILRFAAANPGTPEFRADEADFREAIRLLERLAQNGADRVASLELARAYNNLATLLALDDMRLPEARKFYESAVALDEALTKADPENRVYKMELAKVLRQPVLLARTAGRNRSGAIAEPGSARSPRGARVARAIARDRAGRRAQSARPIAAVEGFSRSTCG